MEESETAIKLEIKNRKRLKLLSNSLDLKRRENSLKMRECSSYEKKKKGKRSQFQTTAMTGTEAREKLK